MGLLKWFETETKMTNAIIKVQPSARIFKISLLLVITKYSSKAIEPRINIGNKKMLNPKPMLQMKQFILRNTASLNQKQK